MVNNPPSVRLDRTLPVPPERVWRALTDPVALGAWFWPFETKVDADPRPGGGYRLESTAMAVGGEYVVVEPPRRLVFTWRWDGEDDVTLVTIDLSAVEGGTALALTHERLADEATIDNHRTGWSDCLDRLRPYLCS